MGLLSFSWAGQKVVGVFLSPQALNFHTQTILHLDRSAFQDIWRDYL